MHVHRRLALFDLLCFDGDDQLTEDVDVEIVRFDLVATYLLQHLHPVLCLEPVVRVKRKGVVVQHDL